MKPEADHPQPEPPRVELRRSTRRRRTVQARREGDVIVVQLPAGMSPREEQQWADKLVSRILRAEWRRRRLPDEDELMGRATRLARAHLDSVVGRAVRPTSVRWVSNQNTRWGSCTIADGTIRLSDRMRGFPEHVIDHVLLHELCHLVEPGHGPRFKALMAASPRAEHAEGFLQGWALARRERPDEPSDGCDPWVGEEPVEH